MNDRSRTAKQKTKPRLWFRVIRATAFSYVLVVVLMVLFENSLVYPAPGSDVGNWEPATPVEEVRFTSEDGTELVGWIIQHPNPKFHILYCHGNAENIALTLPLLLEIQSQFQATIFAFDYRGYGKSSGKPFEAGLCQDGDAALQFFAEHQNRTTEDVVVFGRSLGGGVAVFLASRHSVKALVLHSTFDEMVGVAAGKFWWAPVRLLMKNRFVSTEHAGKVNCSVIQFHGSGDRVIPIEHGKRLHEHFNVTQKRFLEFEGSGHNDPTPISFYREVRAFLDELK